MYTVLKRDGTRQDFDRNKIISALTNAGASSEVCEDIVSQIEAWLETSSTDGVIDYQALKDKVYELISAQDAAAAEKFLNFKK